MTHHYSLLVVTGAGNKRRIVRHDQWGLIETTDETTKRQRDAEVLMQFAKRMKGHARYLAKPKRGRAS